MIPIIQANQTTQTGKHGFIYWIFCFVILCSFFVSLFSIAEEAADREQRIIERFWDILVKSPRRGTTFDRVYTYYIDTGHVDQFLERCRNLTEQNPKHSKFWILYGLAAERRGEMEQAAHAFQTATQLDHEDSVAPFYLGEIRIAQGRLREAITALELSVQRKPVRADVRNVLQTLGRTYERFGDSKKSETIWNQLEKLFPDDTEMLVQIAELLESENRYSEALKRYEKLVEKSNDEFSRVRFMLAIVDIKLQQGYEQDALADLETLLDRLAPESWLAESVRNRIDRIFVRKEDETGLAEFYRNRIEKQPADFESIRRLVLTLRQLKQLGEARKLLTETIEKTPSNIPLRLTLIDFLTEQKEMTAAVAQYEAIDRLTPNHTDYLSRWGQLVFQNTEIDEAARKTEAVKIWTKIAQADPNNPIAAVTVADLLFRNKIYDEAEKFYRCAMELRPDDFSYREYLAIFYHGRGQKKKALEILHPLAENSKQTPENLTQLGNLFLSLGYVTESFEIFQRIAELFPNDLQAQWRFIEALIRKGQPDDIETAILRLTQAERLIETEEQFELFLQQEIRFLKSAQKLAEAAEILEQKINEMHNSNNSNNNNQSILFVRAFWRLAVYRQAEVKSHAATLAIEKALAAVQPPGYRLLRVAAELFEQNGNGEKAIELYKILAERDTIWRADHLKHLALLQVKLGYIDHALETSRTLIGFASGNPNHFRFYADLLLSIGHYEEGINILRQALRIEPGDIATLTLLAQTLDKNGQRNEAIEMTWRLFERTDHLSAQLSIIETLADYYQQSGQLDNLIEQLQKRIRSDDKKRETTLGLARVQTIISDFDAARQTLENLLDMSVDHTSTSNDPVLLKELVFVAEKQKDLNAAVRYQEKLCQLTKDNFETNRLFELYVQAGDTEKADKLFLSRILQKADLQDQLEDIDLMIGREQYDSVKQVLTFLEIHETENWEIPFRRIAVDSYLGGQSVTDSVWEFRSLPFPASLANTTPTTPATSKTVNSASFAWLLPGNLDSKIQNSFELADFAPAEFLESIRLQREFFSTLFRNRLHYNERFLKHNTEILPPKPFLKVDSFREARFLVLGWLLKEAIEQDLNSLNNSKTINSDTVNSDTVNSDTTNSNTVNLNTNNSNINNSKVVHSSVSEPDPNQFINFRKTVEKIRQLLSSENTPHDLLLERIRFEIFLLDLYQLDNSRNPLTNGTLKFQIDRDFCNRMIWEIVRNLGIEGETDWQLAAFQILLAEILDEQIVTRFADMKDNKQQIEQKLGEILDENCLRRGMPPRFPDLRSQLIQFANYLIQQAFEKTKIVADNNSLTNNNSLSNNNSPTVNQKIDQLLEIWETFAKSDEPEQVKIFEQKIAARCSMLVWILKTVGRKTDIARLETTLEHAAQRNPIFLAEIADELSILYDKDTILFLALSGYDSLEKQLERVKIWILNAGEFQNKNEQLQNQTFHFEQRQLLCDAAMKSLCSLLKPIRFGHCDIFDKHEYEVLAMQPELLRDLISTSNQTNQSRLIHRVLGLDAEPPNRRILRSEHIRQISELEYELYILAEWAITFRNNILPPSVSVQETPTNLNTHKNTELPSLPKPLVNYQPELLGQRIVDRTLLQSVLQNKIYYAPLSPFQELFFRIAVIRKMLDTCVKNAEIDTDIKTDVKTQSLLQSYFKNEFNKRFYRLIEKEELLCNISADILGIAKKTENEFTRLDKQLESVRKQRIDQSEPPETTELLTLALLKTKAGHLNETVSILDEMQLKSPLDTKTREFIAAHIGLQLQKENDKRKNDERRTYRQRTEIAFDRLLGYRLSDQEAFQLLPILEQWGRTNDAQTLLDRLVISVSDRKIQNELLHRMHVAGEKQKENAIRISLRIIQNAGYFSDSRHFALDFYIYETALKILRDFGEIDSVAEQLEIRFRGLKDKTDSLIMLANLYLALNRQREAKELTLELARNPSRETDRRNAITALLQHFGFTKQLEEMNERLLEQTTQPDRKNQ
ncbi:MAG: tetratricopeptide repeat protein [Planctomycetaceae bacterium]|nr:tetratricopeptide repeat protein [Planctomycetaceae bacterium]